jgi:hypothetical protein
MLNVQVVKGPPTDIQNFDDDDLAKRLTDHDVEVIREIFNTPLTGSYNWDYDTANTKIRRLYELGKRFNWNVELDIDWGQPFPQNELPSAGEPEGMPLRTSPALLLGVFAAGIYGGYFGAAQGVLLMGIFSALTTEGLQRLNGYKNVLSTGVNFVAAVFFLVFARAQVSWAAAGLIAVGAILGGLLGARIGRSLRPAVLRGVIVTVGVAAVLRMVLAS